MFPRKADLASLVPSLKVPKSLVQFAKGRLFRTDGLPIDDTIAALLERHRVGDADTREHIEGLLPRLMSVSDLTPQLYSQFANNPNSIANWFPALHASLTEAESVLQVPRTRILRLPIELAQFMRVEYPDTNDVSRAAFNQAVFQGLGLEEGETYFLKTGTFSSKFQFANARCTEPEEAGEYFQVINNLAMMLGAGTTVDLCARDYVEPEEGTPTIYGGMPLRCEFRAFVDLDDRRLLGVTPYWHPSVMTKALALADGDAGLGHIAADLPTYQAAAPGLDAEFHRLLPEVSAAVEGLLPALGSRLSGAWSLDIMADRGVLWAIDMATMAESALTEQLLVTDEYSLVDPEYVRERLDRTLVYGEPDVPFTGVRYDSAAEE